jgi:hypothetical protein
MPSVTTSELVERAKAAADMHDNFVTAAQWMYWATQENYTLNLLMARSGWPLDHTTASITITSAQAGVYPLHPTVAPKVMAIISVHESTSAGLRRLLYKDAMSFLHQPVGSSIHEGHARFYRVNRTSDDAVTLNMFPTPQVGQVYVVTYIPQPLKMVTSGATALVSSTTVNFPMGWEERIVLGMARRALEKEESDATPILRQMAEMDSQIEQLCWNRVISEAPAIRNVDRDVYGWDNLGFPPWSEWAWL